MGEGKLNILVVEDEAIIADHIIVALRILGCKPWGPAMNLDEALGYVKRGPVDLALIDINLNGRHDGIELGHHLKNLGQIPHVFLTANTDPKTVQEAKKTVPMGFIVKPFQRSELYSNIEIAMSNWRLMQSISGPNTGDPNDSKSTGEPHVLYVKVNGERLRLFTDEIVMVSSSHVYVEIEMQGGEQHLVRLTMSQILEALPTSRFVRIHRGHIVNLSYVERFDGRYLKLHGHSIPVSKGQKQQLLERLPHLGT
jgi:DNA-binding LytR/AlgR family response regulator